MSSDVQKVFEEIIDLPLAERSKRLAEACKGNDDLRAEVETLLRAYEAAAKFMSEPSISMSGLPVPSSHAETLMVPSPILQEFEKPGDLIGRYRLVEELGEGGFGAVFRAEQTEPVKREVALKIIKVGMDTRQRVARFDAERQALAMMDHPNIAKVLDAGATSTGRLFFVMELVKGDTITAYCDAHILSVAERLGLFRQVCSAVQHAHQKGIIHRDIKPSNVLISMIDGRPVPKVIDFGIAKAVDVRLTDRTLLTETRQVIGTPAYMSPEQADNTNNDIDTRTDVYSLGVLLYELLTGATPFDFSHLSSIGLEAMLRMIRQQDPVKPSVRLTNETSAGVAAHRKTDSRRLESALRGDLDWIVMRCLEKDRSRRYETAQSLSDDVGRYLSNEPVLAGPPSVSYRARKFYKRHRTGVFVAAGVLTLVVGSGAALVASNIRISQQRDDSLKAQIAAQSSTAGLGLAFINSLNSSQGTLAEENFRAPLAAFDEKIAGINFERLPRVEYDMRRTLAICFECIGDSDAACKQVERLHTIGEAIEITPETTHRDISEQLHNQSGTRTTVGDSARTSLLLQAALRHLNQARDTSSTLFAQVRLSSVVNDWNKNATTEVAPAIESRFRECLALIDAGTPVDKELRAKCLYYLAVPIMMQQKYAMAMEVTQEARTLYEELHRDTPEHHDVIKCLVLIAQLQSARRQVDEFLRTLEDIQHRTENSSITDDVRLLLVSIYSRAVFAGLQNESLRLPEMESRLASAIDPAAAIVPEGNPNLCQGMLALAATSYRQKDYVSAEKWSRRAYQMCASHDDWPAEVTRKSREHLAGVLEQTNRLEAAADIMLDLVALDKRLGYPQHSQSKKKLKELEEKIAKRDLESSSPSN